MSDPKRKDTLPLTELPHAEVDELTEVDAENVRGGSLPTFHKPLSATDIFAKIGDIKGESG